MTSTCNHYAARCTKTRPKILRPQNSEKEKTAPGLGQKRRNRVRFRCWRGGCRCEWVRKPEIRTKMHHIAMQHMEKANRRKPSVFAGFVAGAEGLEPSARGFGVDVGTNHQKQGRTGVARFLTQVPKRAVLVWCCEEIFRAKTGKRVGK